MDLMAIEQKAERGELLTVEDRGALVADAQQRLARGGAVDVRIARGTVDVLQRQQEKLALDAKVIVETAEREGRALLASEKRDVEKAQTSIAGLRIARRGLQDQLTEADARQRVPESQRQAAAPASTRGFLPSLREYEARAMGITLDSAGGYLDPVRQSAQFFDLLRPATVVMNLGIPVFKMEGSELNLPGLSSSASASWFAENVEITASDMVLKAITLTARKLGARVLASREWINDSSPSARVIVEQDLIKTMAAAVDLAFLQGDGSGANPRGLRNLSGPTVTTLGSGQGAVITLDDVAGAISRAKIANAVPGAIVCHPRTEAQLRLLKDGDGHYIWQPSIAAEGPARLFGLPIYVSSQVSIAETVGSNTTTSWLAVVDPRQLAIGAREQVELLYDPYSRSSYDQVVIRATCRMAGLGLLNNAGVEIIAGLSAA